MEYSVPVYWNGDYIRSLLAVDRQHRIKEAYGIPAGREGCLSILPLSRQGIRFNCLLDALCMDNLEFASRGQRKITALLDSFVEAGAGAVTVANPYLAMLIKKRYPGLSIVVSAAANINTPARANFWESLGVDAITLPGPVWNHDLAALNTVRKSVKCGIRLAANNGCIRNCPMFLGHRVFDSHAQESARPAKAFDYYRVICLTRRLERPELYIRSDWIRPEDTRVYEDYGINCLQLTGDGLPERMLKIIAAYLAGSYNGNLMDLLQNCPQNAAPGCLSAPAQVYIENNKLNSFLRDMPGDCEARSCESCSYCKKAAEQSVTIPGRYRDETLRIAGEIINELSIKGIS
ncbi:MAG: U32 family peptidase [Candidatus Omnitrophica bacterium]|jgi:collagenase-like PrtC family protease|nr:U32 family peptidase [Candidatus Omnitrophota bacterium]